MALQSIREWFMALNIFVDDNRIDDTDATIVRIQHLSTRLYLVLLTGAVSVLVLYTSLSMQDLNPTVLTPSQSEYENLLVTYPDTLTCPCSRINIPYGDFVTLTPTLHQVCTSQFISQMVIDTTFDPLTSFYNPLDIRATLSAQLQLLRSFCQLSQMTISDVLDHLLNNTELVSARVMAPSLLNTQVQARIKTHLAAAISVFVRGLTLVRHMSLGNQLISGLNSNFRASFYPQNGYATGSVGLAVQVLACAFQNNEDSWCACQITFSCRETGGIYSVDYNLKNLGTFTNNDSKLELILPGLVSGCIPLESLLTSSLECLYNVTCIAQLFHSVNITKQLNVIQISQYGMNVTVDQIVQNLMIEQWTPNISFSAFFAHCNATSCTYTIAKRNDLLYVVTALLGLYGGLTVFLRLTVPNIVRFIYMCSHRRRINAAALSPSIRLRVLITRVINLNLFPTTDRLERIIRQQRWTTRLYLILLTSAMTILMLYSSLSQQIISKTLTMPTQTHHDNLIHDYGSTVFCPCSRIAIDQHEFVSITYTRHQVCSSDFVSSAWLAFLSSVYSPDYYYIDFRLVGLPSFQLLTDFCSLTQQIIIDSLVQFENTEFISSDLLLEEDLRSRAEGLTTNFITSIERSFARELALIRVTTQGNQLLTGTYANFGLPVSNETTNGAGVVVDIVPGYFTNADGSPCFCARNSTCAQLMGIYYWDGYHETNTLLYTMPSFYFGCMIIDSVLRSTLECFFDNNTCLENILFYLMNSTLPFNVTRLNTTQSSRFLFNSTIETIAYQLFVEKWYTNVSYASYFSSCAPESCTYTYMQRKNILYVIITLLSVYGGLSVSLRIIFPFLVDYIMKKIRNRRQQTLSPIGTVSPSAETEPVRRSFMHRLYSAVRWLVNFLLKLNIFSQNGNQTMARYTTRLYLLMLMTTGLILIIYIGLIDEPTQSNTIQTPSIAKFKVLLSKYSQLSCPCSKLAVPYSSFISIHISFHQICSSEFISPTWLDRVMGYAGYDNVSRLYPNIADFRRQAVTHFELIGLFCQLIDETIRDTLQTFLLSQLISAQPLQESSFFEQVQSLVQQFKTSVSAEFMRNLMLIRQTTQGNAWLTLYTSSWRYIVREAYPGATIFMSPIVYGDCSCATYATCTQPAGVYENETFVELSGFRIGCYPLEALLQSSLNCLFNSTCVKFLELYFPSTTDVTPIQMLVNNGSSKYSANTTIEMLINQLLVEQWATNISYDAFYNYCAPATCIITYKERRSFVVIVTLLLGLLGGLTVALRLLVPLIVYIAWEVYKKVRRNRNTVASIN